MMYLMPIGIFPRHFFLSDTLVAETIAKWIEPSKTVEIHQIGTVKNSELEHFARR